MALTSFVEEEKVHAALDAGASGFLLKDAEADEVAAVVRAAHRGEVHLDPAVAGRLVRSMRTRQQGPTGPDAAIEPGTVLARAARWRMRGSIKVGGRWLRFRAWQVESPHRGFLWAARAGGAIVASDRYINGTGGMDWRLFGLFRVAHADGPDVSRSAAGRAGAEAIWVPTALLPRQGVSWAALDDRSLRAAYRLDDTDIQLQLTLDPHGRLQSVVFDRWGDPDNAGSGAIIRSASRLTGHATCHGLTLPATGRAGWYYGTDRWAHGQFFRSEITHYQPLTSAAP